MRFCFLYNSNKYSVKRIICLSWKDCKIYGSIDNFLALGEILSCVYVHLHMHCIFFSSLFPGKSGHKSWSANVIAFACVMVMFGFRFGTLNTCWMSVWNFKKYRFLLQLEGTISSASFLPPPSSPLLCLGKALWARHVWTRNNYLLW